MNMNLVLTNKFFDIAQNYSFFSVGHIIQLIITAGVLVGGFFLFKNKAHWENKIWIILACASFGLMATILIYSFITGVYNPEWYMPFHICNLFAILFPIMAIFKNKIRTFLYDYTVYFGIIGCIFAISMPATTQLYYPSFHIVSLCTWLYHIVIGLASIYLISSKVYFPKLTNLWRLLLVFIPLIIAAFIFNSFWDTNFSFMNPDATYFPLDVMSQYLGKYFTIVIMALIVVVSIGLMVFSFVLFKLKNELVSKLIAESYIIIYIKENDLFGKIKDFRFIKLLKENEKITQYFESTNNYFDETRLMECYYVVEDELKCLTVEQLGDWNYLYELLKKSKLIKALFAQIKFKKLKALFVLLKKVPASAFLSVVKEYVLELGKTENLALQG